MDGKRWGGRDGMGRSAEKVNVDEVVDHSSCQGLSQIWSVDHINDMALVFCSAFSSSITLEPF